MPSRKQLLYCEFLHVGIIRLRMLCGVAEGCADAHLLRMREAFADGFEEANHPLEHMRGRSWLLGI